MVQRFSQRKLQVLVAVAIIARLALLLAFPQVFAFSEPGVEIHGSVAYDEYASNLVETGVYGRVPGVADAGLPPLYSYALSLIYRLFGRHYVAVGAAHILFDALSIALLYDICRRLLARDPLLGERVGALAGLFFALYPYLIFQNLTLNDTALWILLLQLFVWLLIRLREREALDRGTLLLAAEAGAVLGIATLARALLPALALLAVIWFLLKLSWAQTLLRLLPVALIGLLVVLPWLLRSQRIYGDFVPIALNSGENIFQGNNPQAAAVFRAGYDVQWLTAPPGIPPVEDPVRRNNALAEAGWRYLREHPAAIPDLLLVKLQVYWNPQVTPLRNLRQGERLAVDDGGQVLIISGEGSQVGVTAANAAYQDDGLFNVVGRGVHVLYFGALLLLAMAGVWLSRRKWRMLSLLVFVQVSQTLMYLVFHPSTRYRSPTDPLLFVFSAYAVLWVAAWWRGSNPSPNPLPKALERGSAARFRWKCTCNFRISVLSYSRTRDDCMNRQKPPKGIEWTRIRQADGTELPGYTWNPTGGCFHGCTWRMPDGSITECYAKTIAERFTSGYPYGFEHHYWRPHALDAPKKVKQAAGIFVGSMADLFGHWVPEEQIRQVLDVMADAHWHTFQTLSKFPIRLPQFGRFPENIWVGVSLPAGHLMSASGGARALGAYLRNMKKIEAKVRFMSIEPLWFDVAPVLEEWLEKEGELPFEWAIIGAASNGSRVFQPEEAWTASLIQSLDEAEVPIFFKGNLEWKDRREKFPQMSSTVGAALQAA